MDRGTFQYGRKITSPIFATNTGVCVLNARPTITSMPKGGAPLGGVISHAHRRNIGMFSAIKPFVAEMRQPAEPLEREFDLADAPCERHAQGGYRALAKDAIGFEAVADLEPLDAVDKDAIVPSGSLTCWRICRQIASAIRSCRRTSTSP